MERFFGIMPVDEIEIEKVFKDSPESSCTETIQAGPNGWSILWADHGSTCKDESIGTDENLKNAIAELKKHFPDAIEVEIDDDEIDEEICEEMEE